MSKPTRVGASISWQMLLAVAAIIVAVVTSFWAISLQNRVDDLEANLADVRANANASVTAFSRTETSPANISGQAYVSLSGSGVIVLSNLPYPGDNDHYHLWYLDGDAATSGGEIAVSDTGQAFALIPADAPGYDRIAISIEPIGATQPGGSYVLVADISSTRG